MKKSKKRVLSEIHALIPSLEIELHDKSGGNHNTGEFINKIECLIRNAITLYDDEGQLGLLEKDFILQAIFALERRWYCLCIYKMEDSISDPSEFSSDYPRNEKAIAILNKLTKQDLINELDSVVNHLEKNKS